MQPVCYTMIYCCAYRYISPCKSCILYTNSHTWKICILHARLSLSDFASCLLSLRLRTDFNLWFAVCKHSHYNRMTPVSTDWLTDAFTCGVSLWDTNYTSCRGGVPSGTVTFDLPYANTHVIIIRCPVSTDWLIDVSSRGGSFWDTNYMSCRHRVPSGTLTCDLPYANTRVIIVWLLVSHKLHILSMRSTHWNWSHATC